MPARLNEADHCLVEKNDLSKKKKKKKTTSWFCVEKLEVSDRTKNVKFAET